MSKRKMPAQQPATSRQDYRTEVELLDAVKRRLNITEFDCDLAADADNTVADVFYDIETNALAGGNSWKQGDGWNWLNPEFGMIEDFAAKAWQQTNDERAKTVMLVPAGVGANWWRDFVHRKAQVLFLNGRLCFIPDWETQLWGPGECIETDPVDGREIDRVGQRKFISKPLYPKDTALLLYYPPSSAAGHAPWYDIWSWRAPRGK
ncbi:MAG: DNA N-6-adenine-methyltransferase [Thermoanaerobaculia bacterium]